MMSQRIEVLLASACSSKAANTGSSVITPSIHISCLHECLPPDQAGKTLHLGSTFSRRSTIKHQRSCCNEGWRYHWHATRSRKEKRKDYAFWRQFNEKPSIIPGCPEPHTLYISPDLQSSKAKLTEDWPEQVVFKVICAKQVLR